jgi:hypothetical protein
VSASHCYGSTALVRVAAGFTVETKAGAGYGRARPGLCGGVRSSPSSMVPTSISYASARFLALYIMVVLEKPLVKIFPLNR